MGTKKLDTAKIVSLYKSGNTVAQIADKFDISKKCVQQIVSNNVNHPALASPTLPKKRGVPQYPKV